MTPDPDSEPVVWLFTAIVGAAIAGFGAGLYTSAPPATGGEEFSDETILGVLLAVLGIGLLGVGLLVLVVTVSARILHNARRRHRRRR